MSWFRSHGRAQVPAIGGYARRRRRRLEPEHIEKLYSKMRATGLAAGTIHHVHRTLRASLSEAVRRKHVSINAAITAKAPRVEEEEIEPLTVEEAKRLLLAAAHRRNGTRWAVALALGLRQGETLGLQWTRVDLATATVQVRHALQRRTWQHGCSDSHQCGERYHKMTPCKTGCRRHKRSCPPPCPPDCTGHARWCPHRQQGGLVLDDVKSRAGRRTIALPSRLVRLLTGHQAAQRRERDLAGDLWDEREFVFTNPAGQPLDPRADNREWAELLKEAAVREARLHDARHTAPCCLS